MGRKVRWQVVLEVETAAYDDGVVEEKDVEQAMRVVLTHPDSGISDVKVVGVMQMAARTARRKIAEAQPLLNEMSEKLGQARDIVASIQASLKKGKV